MILSSGPHPAVGGKAPTNSVMSGPITAKSPPSISQMSGQPLAEEVCWPFACGSGPMRWVKLIFICVFGLSGIPDKLSGFPDNRKRFCV